MSTLANLTDEGLRTELEAAEFEMGECRRFGSWYRTEQATQHLAAVNAEMIARGIK